MRMAPGYGINQLPKCIFWSIRRRFKWWEISEYAIFRSTVERIGSYIGFIFFMLVRLTS